MTEADIAGFLAVRRSRLRLILVAALSIGLHACTMYDPRAPKPLPAPPGVPTTGVRVCGDENELEFAQRVLVETRLFATVKPCSAPLDEADVQATVGRPICDRGETGEREFLLFMFTTLSVGVIPGTHCVYDLTYRFHGGALTEPVSVNSDRTVRMLYGWLPMLLAPLPEFHLGYVQNAQPAADGLRNTILTQAPSVVEPPRAAAQQQE